MRRLSAFLVLAFVPLVLVDGAVADEGKAPDRDPKELAAELARLRGPRDMVIIRIANEGERARFLWPKLVAILESGAPSERVCAAWALGWIGASEAVPALGKALGSREWQVVFAAAGTLGNFGAAAKEKQESGWQVVGITVVEK
jgi:HEAT repeat protein